MSLLRLACGMKLKAALNKIMTHAVRRISRTLDPLALHGKLMAVMERETTRVTREAKIDTAPEATCGTMLIELKPQIRT